MSFSGEVNNKISNDFPGLKTQVDGMRVTYLDSAATSLKPQSMIDAVSEYYSGISSNVHRGKNYSLELVSNRFESARYKVAELISCSGNEVVFVKNTTEAINLVADGLGLTKEDIVITCSDAHHSNLLPWMERADVRAVNTDNDANLDLGHFEQLLQLNPKVVALTHCSNVTGIYHPIEQMIKAAKAVGAIVVVDAAQSIPHRKVNVKELDVDFLSFSAHKMLGPTGVGVLYGRADMLEQLKPQQFGGGMVDWVDLDSSRKRKIPHRFEAGTPNIAGAYGMGAAVDYIFSIGYDEIAAHDKHMAQLMLKLAAQRNYLEVINSDANQDRGAVLSFKIPGTPNLDEVARILSDSYGIMCRNGHLCAQPFVDKHADGQVLRVSGYIYTTDADIELFFESLDEISDFLF